MKDEIEIENLIVGSGAAGASLGKILSDKNKSFLICELDNSNNIFFNHEHNIKSLQNTLASPIRTVHAFGGGTNLWGGGLVEFTKYDFDDHSSFGSDKLFEKLRCRYGDAWQFFGFEKSPRVRDRNENDFSYGQKKPLNFNSLVNKECLIEGKISSFEKNGGSYKAIIIETSQKQKIRILFKNLILANGTLGILSLLNQFRDVFTEIPLERLMVGLYTHPKCSINGRKVKTNLIEESPDNFKNFRIYRQFRFGSDLRNRHAVRLEPKYVNLLENILNLSSMFIKFSFVRNYISKVFRFVFNRANALNNSIFGSRLKIFINSKTPNFNIRFNPNSDKVDLYFNKDSIDLKKLNVDINSLGTIYKPIGLSDITTIHTHFMGGLKLRDGQFNFIQPTGKVSGSKNLWLHGPILMNAQGYANPVLSIVALSHVIGSDLYDA